MEREQKYARCGDCHRPLRLTTETWGGRVAWSEESRGDRTVYFCYGCTRIRGGPSYWDMPGPKSGRPKSVAS